MASSMTWLLVIIYPSSEMMTPLPAPEEIYCSIKNPPLVTLSVVISTTEFWVISTTCCTVILPVSALTVEAGAEVFPLLVCAVDPCRRLAERYPPPKPAAAETTTPAARIKAAAFIVMGRDGFFLLGAFGFFSLGACLGWDAYQSVLRPALPPSCWPEGASDMVQPVSGVAPP